MWSVSLETIPTYVLGRGEQALQAFQRAKANGKTLDKRVKVSVIGPDRVGKTSLVRSLKGEKFNPNVTSTDGVQMHEPLKNPGRQPWRNSIMHKETTVYHYKCAEYIRRELSESQPKQTPQKGQELGGSSDKLTKPDFAPGEDVSH